VGIVLILDTFRDKRRNGNGLLWMEFDVLLSPPVLLHLSLLLLLPVLLLLSLSLLLLFRLLEESSLNRLCGSS
jgi:hypothetical protein